MSADTQSLVVGGGCFWCTDAAFKLLPGVTHVTSGYSGGHVPHPTYEQVCGHGTGHIEVTKVDFDPSKVSLEAVIDYFWRIHNPTQVGGQGNDEGPQYRSVIFYQGDLQKKAAEAAKARASQVFRDPIATEIRPLETFWPAEEYHQDYFDKHPDQGYCRFVIAPKIKKLSKELHA